MIYIFTLVILLILFNSRSLILVLLLLEILGFFLIYFVSLETYRYTFRDFITLAFFSLLVIEGVIALSGLISLVSYAGGDYLISRSILKF